MEPITITLNWLLWDYYKRDKAVSIIIGKAKIYKQFGRIDLETHAFPVPLRSNPQL